MKVGNRNNLPLTCTGIIIGFFYIAPFYIIVVNAFKTKRELFENHIQFPRTWILDNFSEAVGRMNYFRSLGMSLIITAGVLLLILLISSAAGWMLLRNKGRFSAAFFYSLIASLMVPFQATMIPLLRLLNKSNLVSPPGLILIQTGFGLPMSIFLFYGFIKALPVSLEEAAVIDNCTPLQIYRCVLLPLVKPVAVTVAVLNGLWVWNGYLMPSLILKKGYHTLPVSMFSFFGQYTRQWNTALAGIVITMIPIIIFYVFAQRYVVSGITAGAQK